MEVRDLLNKYNYKGDDIKIIHGSALGALEGTEFGVKSIDQLMDAIDAEIPGTGTSG